MSNLLQVIRVKPKAVQQKTNNPLLVEVPVNPDLAPFLVSSTKGVVWVEEAHPGNMVKAAVRPITAPNDVFQEILGAVVKRGQQAQWGSVHPFSEAGVWEAIRHLEFHGLEDIELLVPRQQESSKGKKRPKAPEWLSKETFNLPIRFSSWVPENCVVALPIDRAFVGVMVHIAPKLVVVAVHNASRGIGVAQGA